MDLGAHSILTSSPLRNFTHMVDSGEGGWICVDPYDGEEVEAWLGERGGRLAAVVNTHEHWDHVRGNSPLAGRHRCPVLAHRDAGVPGMTGALAEGDSLPLSGGRELRIAETPGHTKASLTCLLVAGGRPRAAFTGDTLFNAGVGNCHNGGDPRTLHRTISGAYGALPGDLLVYPGHEYMGNNLRFTLSVWPDNGPAGEMLEAWRALQAGRGWRVTSMAEEREVNAFLRLERFAPPGAGAPELERAFLELRRKRDRW